MPFNITAGFDTVINNGAGLVPIVQPALTYFEEDPDSPTHITATGRPSKPSSSAAAPT